MLIPRIIRRSLAGLIALTIALPAIAGPPTLDPTYVPDIAMPGADVGAPARIWAAHAPVGETVAFRKSFDVIDTPTWTSLIVYSSGSIQVLANGQTVGRSERVQGALQYDIAALLHPGRNLLEIRAGGGRGSFISAWLQIPGQAPIVSDASWSARADKSWAPAVEKAPAAGEPIAGWPVPSKPLGPPATSEPVNWIWANLTKDNQTIYLRKSFQIDKIPAKAMLSATVDDAFTAYINGVEASKGSGWGTVVNSDVTRLLHKGRNVVAIRAINYVGSAGVISQIDADDAIVAPSDLSWRVTMASDPGAGWNAIDFDDSGWVAPVSLGGVHSNLYLPLSAIKGWPSPAPAEPVYLQHYNVPVASVIDVHPGAGAITGADALVKGGMATIMPPPAGSNNPPSILVDFGEELNGRVCISSSGPANISVGTGEWSTEAQVKPWVQAVLNIAPGASPQYTTITGLRYAVLTFPPTTDGAPEHVGVSIDHIYYPVTYKGSFDCPDRQLTRMWYTGAYTAHLCMQNDIWDGIKRDRCLWAGDGEPTGETIAVAFGDLFLTEHSILRSAPQSPNPKHHVNWIPGYSAAWVMGLGNHYRHLGDSTFLHAMHDPLVAILKYMRGDLDGDLLFQNLQPHTAKFEFMYCDSCPGVGPVEDNPESRAITGFYYIEAFREASYLLGQMGDKSNADAYAKLADGMKAAARAKLVDAGSNTFGERTQVNTRAIIAGVATPDQEQAIYSQVLKPGSPGWVKPASSNKPRIITPYYLYFMLPLYTKLEHSDDALLIARAYWGQMLDAGATSYWEGFYPDWHIPARIAKPPGFGGSSCHAWASGITSWLTEYLLGVRSTGPAWQTLDIVPDLAGLSWAAGDVPTPRGPIRVHASAHLGRLQIAVEIPTGTTASVGVPGREVIVNGKIAKSDRTDGDRSFVTLHTSGKYLVEGR